ncbi:MAG TPA: TAT-variant-translocated molybdopterin oxidoreductase, partial [Opitutaceae bacterium]|nr:TAT-variant-translocated molybdopterin oxidoreductase [Opitutaceae bacterium]
MKRKVEHPEASVAELRGPRYWRSLDELAETPGFKAALAREFPDGASGLDGVDRRQFMKIMAASFALGGIGMAGCRRPEENILPFGKSEEGAVPGLPVYYATAMPIRRWAVPLLAETHQGRPTKLEGNPSYLPLGGASSLFAQASVLDLYDPDRATAHTRGGAVLDAAAVKELLAGIGKAHAADRGAGLAFLADESSSYSRFLLASHVRAKYPKAIWAEYEPVADEPPMEAALTAFSLRVKPVYRFGAAKRIVSIDADFLQAEAGSPYYAREFAKGRRVGKKDDPMNRLYAAESALSITGTMADHRLRLPSGHMFAFAAALALRVTGDKAYARAAEGLELPAGWVEECAADLMANRGECLVVAGAHLPADVHVVAYAINEALGNIGRTVEFVFGQRPLVASIGELAAAMKRGDVKTLVILGGNPVYNAPADLEWAALQKAVPEVIRVGYYVDETSALAGTHIAAAHYLESWGDARTVDGTVVPIQPMIMPLFGGLTQNEVLAMLAGLPNTDPYRLVFLSIVGGLGKDSEAVFRKFLHDGQLEGTQFRPVPVRFNSAGAGLVLARNHALPAVSREAIEVRFVAGLTVDDGRFANNGWLQE